MSKRMVGNLMLLVAALIWGSAFVAQSVGLDYVGPITFQAVRCLLGSAVLLPVIFFMDRHGSSRKPTNKAEMKYLLLSGLACGICLFFAMGLQQLGLVYTTAGKSGFLTSLYIIFVPMIGMIAGKKVSPWIWVSVVLAAAGLYLLCGEGGFSMGPGELLTLACAVAFAFHILIVDRVSPHVDGVRLSCLQFFVCGVISLVVMFLTEEPDVSAIIHCWLPICYAGVLSSGVAYTLQILAQSRTEPTVASLLMSLESVFAVLTGWIILREALTLLEFLGCVLVFGGVILAQLPNKK